MDGLEKRTDGCVCSENEGGLVVSIAAIQEEGSPMQASSKKIVAAISAVMQFIQEEQCPRAEAAAAPAPAALPAFSSWGLAGRQDAMLFRTLWQRRLGRGC
ncbi:MAG: hypothetical protein E4G90_09400 [Gemmatimonadales bacterium]|nr:MAG: hypothetical protein E4G90_09400 [Gemmatimonadales bacterium]